MNGKNRSEPEFAPPPTLRDRIDIMMGFKQALAAPGDGRVIPESVIIKSSLAVGRPRADWTDANLQEPPMSLSSTWQEFFEDARYLGETQRGECGRCRWSMGQDASGVAWLVGLQLPPITLSMSRASEAHILVCDNLDALKKAWAESADEDGLKAMGAIAHALIEQAELGVAAGVSNAIRARVRI